VTKTAEQLVELLGECHEEILCWQGANLVSCQPDEIADAISQLARERDQAVSVLKQHQYSIPDPQINRLAKRCAACGGLNRIGEGHLLGCPIDEVIRSAPTEGGEKTAAELP
jgi:hypothetical protein